jgi:hypothetical protein
MSKTGAVLAQLARAEQQRRRDAEAERQFQVTDRRAKGSLIVSKASLVISVLALIIAVVAL